MKRFSALILTAFVLIRKEEKLSQRTSVELRENQIVTKNLVSEIS